MAAQAVLIWQVEKPNGCNAVQAQLERMGRDASESTHLQQQVQSKERLLGEANDAIEQTKVCFALLPYVCRCNASCQSISLSCTQHVMHCHLDEEIAKD